MNKIPGFTAEASLSRSFGSYRSLAALNSAMKGRLEVVPMQIHHPFPLPLGGTPIPGLPPPPPYNPIGTWPTTPPPYGPPPPPVVGGGGAVAGGAGAAGGISIWWVIPGIIVGTIIGGVIGEGIDWVISEDTPPPTLPVEGCQVLSPSPNPHRQISGSHWGCTNSESEVVNAAHARCSATTTCSGACSSGKPCAPYASIYDIVQIPGLFSCDTTVYYKCACGCG